MGSGIEQWVISEVFFLLGRIVKDRGPQVAQVCGSGED